MRTDRDARAGADARPDPLIGRLVDGRYRLTRRIARGGMAGVYEAQDVRLDRVVALKVMHPGMGDEEEFSARFVREARAAAKLAHPNVVAVYDQGEDDGLLYLAMELVDGHTLRDTITAQAPLPAREAVRLLEPVLTALAAAHRAGLVHRDVKPENVLISEAPDSAGAVKVADFGLARAVSGQTQHTSAGTLIGTVSYIAPELVVDGSADARADVYSCGVVLFELLTGQKPHAGETPIQVAYKHVHDDVPAPSTLVPGIPDYVDALVARATARDRDLRPSDAGVLLHQLHRVRTALRDGLDSDPELTADLALPVLPAVADAGADAAEPTLTVPTAAAPPHSGDHEPTTLLSTAGAPPPADDVPTPRRWRDSRLLRGLLALVVVAALGVGGWWLFEGRYTRTPALVGMTQAEATERLDTAGLGIEVERDFSDTVPKGEVIGSEPGRGEKVTDGGDVTVTISKGVEEYELPRLKGADADTATERLEELGMVPHAVERWSETVAEGDVIRTDPAAGTVLRPDTEITVMVSKGREPLEITDWTGKSASKAATSMRERGLEVTVERQFSDDVPEGEVISQSPDGGTLYRGDTVTLLVSRGPEMVEVPSVTGRGVDSARQALEDAGFEVEVEEYDISFGLGFVMTQDPSGGMARKGSTVTLRVN